MTTGTATTPAKTGSEGDKKAEPAKKPSAASDAVKIPAFLDCTITAAANEVVYDNLTLKNFGGKMVIRDEAVAIQNAKTSVFGGNIGCRVNVSTIKANPAINLHLALNSLDIPQAFTQLEMLKKIAPIAEVLSGKFNAAVKVGGNLDSKEMTPDLNSLTGNLGGSLANAVLHADKSKVLQALTSKVKVLDPSKLNLNQKINLTFNDGKVNILPFVVKYKNQDIKISGTHGFDQQMAYTAGVELPAKDFDQLVDKAAALKVDISKIVVPVNINITGTFQSPKISTDVDQGIKAAVTQLAKQEKDRVVNDVKEKATEKGKELLGNILNGKKNNGTTTDTTKTKQNTSTKQQAEDAAKSAGKSLLNSIFKKKDKKEE